MWTNRHLIENRKYIALSLAIIELVSIFSGNCLILFPVLLGLAFCKGRDTLKKGIPIKRIWDTLGHLNNKGRKGHLKKERNLNNIHKVRPISASHCSCGYVQSVFV